MAGAPPRTMVVTVVGDKSGRRYTTTNVSALGYVTVRRFIVAGVTYVHRLAAAQRRACRKRVRTLGPTVTQ